MNSFIHQVGLLFITTLSLGTAWASPTHADVELEYEQIETTRAIGPRTRASKWGVRHGFRLGYTYGHNLEHHRDFDIDSPHMSTMGYEVTEGIESGVDGFRIVFVQNIVISGLEQGKFLPSVSALVGYEVFDIAQMGVGANVGPLGPRLILAAGLNPQVGDFQLPVHIHFIPDTEGDWRIGVSTGVNF